MTAQISADLQAKYPVAGDFLNKMPPPIRERAVLIEIPPYRQTARKGDSIAYVDALIAGTMRVLNEFESGHVFSFAYIAPLSYIGSYEAVAKRDEYSATTESISPCTLIRLKQEDFQSWFASASWFSREVAYRMAGNICDQSYKHGEVQFYPAAYLIADYLIRMFESLEGNPKKIPEERQDMADHLGFSVRTINRCIQAFRKEGLIGTDKGKLILSKVQYEKLKRKNEEIKEQL